MIPVRIAGTAGLLPGRQVTNVELVARAVPSRNADDIESRTGIRARYWSDPERTMGLRSDDDGVAPISMAELGAEAMRRALEAANLGATDLRRLIVVSSTAGDRIIPTTASEVTHALGLRGSCDSFDVSNACMGFLSALDIGARSVQTGLFPVGIVVTEMLSRFITPTDPRPFFVLADGVAAAVLVPGRPGEGILATALGTDRSLGDSTRLVHGGLGGTREHIEFMQSNQAMTDLALATLVRTAKSVLATAGERLAEVEWVVPHQPNGRMLQGIIEALELDPDRVVPMVSEIGSVGAASIPLSLDRLFRTRDVRPGDRILMVGVGAGVSYGATLYRVAA